MNLYKWFWSKTLGRPYTYWLRDLWHKAEFVWIIALICLGVVMGHHLDWIKVLIILGIFTIGFVFGHLFWGTKYIEGQQGNGDKKHECQCKVDAIPTCEHKWMPAYSHGDILVCEYCNTFERVVKPDNEAEVATFTIGSEDDILDDGCGSKWPAWCPECDQKSMFIVRPGEVQCSNCD